jgi:hypothetical protein
LKSRLGRSISRPRPFELSFGLSDE